MVCRLRIQRVFERPTDGPTGRSPLLLIVLGTLILSVLSAAPGRAQERPAAPSVPAPQLVAPASGTTVSQPDSLRFRWTIDESVERRLSDRYRQVYERLVVTPVSVDSTAGADRAEPAQTRRTKTHLLLRSSPPSSPPDSAQKPYPVVGAWFPEPGSPRSSQGGVRGVRLSHPVVGDWFPGASSSARLPNGTYSWEVALLGRTRNGETERLATSESATFTVQETGAAGTRDRQPAAADTDGGPATPSDPGATPAPHEHVTLALMARGGVFLPGVSSVQDLSSEASSAIGGEQSVFTWGASMAFGSRDGPVNLRLTGLRTTGSLTPLSGSSSGARAGRDRMLALTADLVVRPLPPFLLQPYVIGGVGAQRLTVQRLEDGAPTSRWETAGQIGVGVDVRVGDVTVGAELVDYVTGVTGSGGGVRHNGFAFLVIGLPVF